MIKAVSTGKLLLTYFCIAWFNLTPPIQLFRSVKMYKSLRFNFANSNKYEIWAVWKKKYF